MKKRMILVAVIGLCLLLLTLTAGAETVHSETWGQLSWFLDSNGLLTVTGAGAMDRMVNLSSDAWLKYRSEIRTVIIGDGVTSIGDNAFLGCGSLTNVTIPGTVTEIGQYAFSGCSGLTGVILPEGVATIGDGAFFYCDSLVFVVLPYSVTGVGRNPFQGCMNLAEIQFSATHPYLELTDGVLFSKPDSRLICYPCALTAESYSIPDTTMIIGEGAFADCPTVSSVKIPKSVTAIGDSAFFSCTSLKAVSIPKGVKAVEANTFSNCESLSSVTIPSTVTVIGNYAFYGCTSLSSVTIPNKVKSIGDSAFYGCTSLLSVAIPDSVHSFGADIFSTKPEVTCSKSSDAAFWAANAKYSIIYSDAGDITITTQPRSVTAAEGNTATFKVAASGNNLKYQWYYMKPDAAEWTEVYTNGTSATYTLTTAERHNGYSYRCKVSDEVGSVYSDTAFLTVVTKPAIKTQPKSVTVAEGGTATFKVVASGSDLKYQWYYMKPGTAEWVAVYTNGTSDTYTLTAASRHNGYVYRCEVSNIAGVVYSSTVTLTVK